MTAPLMERNSLIGGMPGQGKSSGARVMMTGAALDPTAELRIAVPDTNFDFEALKPRYSVYIMGAETERIEETRDELRAAKASRKGPQAARMVHSVSSSTNLPEGN